MAAQREPDQVEIISGIKGALNRQKSNFSRRISNVHKLRDLDQTFQALGKVAEAVVKGKYGPLRDRYQHRRTGNFLGRMEKQESGIRNPESGIGNGTGTGT